MLVVVVVCLTPLAVRALVALGLTVVAMGYGGGFGGWARAGVRFDGGGFSDRTLVTVGV